MSLRPPRMAAALLAWVTPRAWHEHFAGDLEEEFASRAQRSSSLRAGWWYRGQVARVVLSRLTPSARIAPLSKGTLMTRLRIDLHAACRTLRRQPRYVALILLILGGSLGTSGAVLAMVNAYLWMPLPYPSPDRLVEINTFTPGVPQPRDRSALDHSALGDIADLVVAWDIDGFTIVGDDNPEAVDGKWITADVFPMFGVEPVAGRVFTREEVATASPVAVISHRLWQDRFGADPATIGRTLTVRGVDRPDETVSFTIIGVLPHRFWHLNDRTDLLVPLRGPRQTSLARLREGLSVEAARDLLSTRLHAANSTIDPRFQLGLSTLHDLHVTPIRDLLQAVATGVGLLLLIACSNLAMLQAVRAMARQREIAVKTALGASRSRVVGQLVAEGTLMATGAFFIAWGLADALIAWVLPLVETYVGRVVAGGATAATVSAPILGLMAAVAILSTVGLGLLPVFRRPIAVSSVLVGHATGADTPQRARARQTIVTLQVAATMTLLVGASLMMRTAWHLGDTDLGFEPAGVMTSGLTLHRHVYPQAEHQRAGMTRILGALEALPDVESATLMAGAPFGARGTRAISGDDRTADEGSPQAAIVAVTPSYFQTWQIPVAEGRTLSGEDTELRERVAVISASLAEALWPGASAIGRSVTAAPPAAGMRQAPAARYLVVGVVADVRRTLRAEPVPEIYVPLAQSPQAYLSLQVRGRASVSPTSLTVPVARAILNLDRELPLDQPLALDAVVARDGVRPRFLAAVLGGFAALAALVALVGVYAISAWVARHRRREAAVRLALGAQPRDVIRTLTLSGAGAVLAGLALGWIGSLNLAHLLAEELTGIEAGNVPIRAAIALILFATCVSAVVWPARSVAATDPAAALRE